jgi:hypothetical protein
MMGFLRSLFGLHGVTGNRTVVGKPDQLDVQDLPYIQDSNKRLSEILELYEKYKGTPYAQKIYTVYEKTKRIHTYLISRSKANELELFHLQHTDHFLNTFLTIIDAHRPAVLLQNQRVRSVAPEASPSPSRPEVIGRTFVLGPFRSETKEVRNVKMQAGERRQRDFAHTVQDKLVLPELVAPEIAIDTYSRIVYLNQSISDGLTTSEIGYTSSPEEKEAFVAYVSRFLGIANLSYVGNTMVRFSANNRSQPTEVLPVINWNKCPYILHLEEGRLYPVRTFGKSK